MSFSVWGLLLIFQMAFLSRNRVCQHTTRGELAPQNEEDLTMKMTRKWKTSLQMKMTSQMNTTSTVKMTFKMKTHLKNKDNFRNEDKLKHKDEL